MGDSYVFVWKFKIWLLIKSCYLAFLLHPGSWGVCLLNLGAHKNNRIPEWASETFRGDEEASPLPQERPLGCEEGLGRSDCTCDVFELLPEYDNNLWLSLKGKIFLGNRTTGHETETTTKNKAGLVERYEKER